MKFLIEKIELLDGEYYERGIRLKLIPKSGLQGSFIKLKGSNGEFVYVANGRFKKDGYNDFPREKIPDYNTVGYSTTDFYLTFLIGGKKSIDDIQYLQASENYSYQYQAPFDELSGHIHLGGEEFKRMWDSLVNKTFPTTIDIFIPQEFYSKYDYHGKPWTPWDLSELEPVSSHSPSNSSVPILNYAIQYDLLETNEYEKNKLAEKKAEKLWDYEYNFLYKNTKYVNEEPQSEKQLEAISKQIGCLAILLIMMLVVQVAFFIFRAN